MMRFEWDETKAAANLAKHGVSFNEAVTVLGDALGWSYPDPEHSLAEERWLVIGMHRVLVVAYTAHADTIRLLSARQATRKERSFDTERAELL